MRVVRSRSGVRGFARLAREEGRGVAFVPTMGFLHAGHVRLMDRARKEVGEEGRVVVSIYVNPTQFGPTEDLSRYPRDLKGDLAKCRGAGVDMVFVPPDQVMYPDGVDGQTTYVVEGALSRVMEGASRPTHFRGVTTVVMKLFNLVQPDVAVFGAKDWQQSAVVGRMIRDLQVPVRLVVAPTAREEDGLAMSSRNVYLNEAERAQAVCLVGALRLVRSLVRGRRVGVGAGEIRRRLGRWFAGFPLAEVDYVEFFHPTRLEPVGRVCRGDRMALAVRFGRTRLIDNGAL